MGRKSGNEPQSGTQGRTESPGKNRTGMQRKKYSLRVVLCFFHRELEKTGTGDSHHLSTNGSILAVRIFIHNALALVVFCIEPSLGLFKAQFLSSSTALIKSSDSTTP